MIFVVVLTAAKRASPVAEVTGSIDDLGEGSPLCPGSHRYAALVADPTTAVATTKGGISSVCLVWKNVSEMGAPVTFSL